MNENSPKIPMACPACNARLPFYFALPANRKKKVCPACHTAIISSKESYQKVLRECAIISFFSGIPLGVMCFYIGLGTSRVALALFLFLLGAAGIYISAYTYSRSHLDLIRDRSDTVDEH